MENIEGYLNPDNNEDDVEEEDEDDSSDSKTKGQVKLRAGKDLLELFTRPEKAKDEKEDDPDPKETDKTPELDAEAPLEHLSRAEELAISQTLAEERLSEVEHVLGNEVTNEYLAAISYLEAVASTGYIDEEFESVASEYGVDVSQEAITVAETSATILPGAESTLYTRSEPEKPSSFSAPAAVPRPERVTNKPNEAKETAGIVSYLMSRRKARIKNKASEPIVERDLTHEVGEVRNRLEARESQIRQIIKTREVVSPITRPSPVEAPVNQAQPERPASLPDKVKPQEVMEPVQAEIKAQTMNREELLKMASKIEIEGAKLSTIYQNNLLGERGLRRVVAEYLRGGNVKKILRREMVEREIDYERDPVLRDRGDGTPVTHKPTTIDSLLEKSGINWNEEQHTVVPERVKQKPKLDLEKLTTRKRPPVFLDILLAFLIIGLLLTLIIVLYKK